MYCYRCGKEIPDNSGVCPECGAVLSQPAKKRELKLPSMHPMTAVGMALAIIAFIFGFCMITTSLAVPADGGLYNILFLVPALAAFCIGIHQLFGADADKKTKLMAKIMICIASFVLLYAFICVMVFMAG